MGQHSDCKTAYLQHAGTTLTPIGINISLLLLFFQHFRMNISGAWNTVKALMAPVKAHIYFYKFKKQTAQVTVAGQSQLRHCHGFRFR